MQRQPRRNLGYDRRVERLRVKIQILVSIEELNTVRAAARFMRKPEPIIVICCSCPSKENNQQQLLAHGFQISHGLCVPCAFAARKELDALGTGQR
jgi:hypothetical protein